MPPEIHIQPIGAYFQNDKNGYVVNPASSSKIPKHWLPVIELIKQSFMDQLGGDLHSIYLRGSLVRGLAIDYFSDLDSFALVKAKGLRWKDAPWWKELNKKIVLEFDFINKIELMLSSIQLPFYFESPNVPMLLKTQSLCIFGEDLSRVVPKFKPDKSMMLNYRWIEMEFDEFKTKKELSEVEFQNYLKVVIRTGFEIVMEKEGRFTPDLYLCYKSFSHHFPEWKDAMEKALFCYINPSNKNKETSQMIKDLSGWLVGKVKTQLL